MVVTATAGVVVMLYVTAAILVGHMVTFYPLPLAILSQACVPISSTFSRPLMRREVLGLSLELGGVKSWVPFEVTEGHPSTFP